MALCVSVFQVPLVEQAAPIGSPLAFPGSIMMSSSIPPVGAPFERTQLAPGKTVEYRYMYLEGDVNAVMLIRGDCKLETVLL